MQKRIAIWIVHNPNTSPACPRFHGRFPDNSAPLKYSVLDRLHEIVCETLGVRGKSKIDQNGITSIIDELDRAKGFIKLLWFSIDNIFEDCVSLSNFEKFP